MKKIISIGFLLIFTSISSFASDAQRLFFLEKEVQEIKFRLSKLESSNQVRADSKSATATVAGDGWKYQKSWRALTTGMNFIDVRNLLGEPQQVRGGNVAVWTYPNKGEVTFLSDSLYQWQEPKW
jgi:hypothetical protein